jgi:hypothetical protein
LLSRRFPRISKAAKLAARPPDAWLAARMAAWRLALVALKRVLPLPRLVRLMGRPASREHRAGGDERIASLAASVFWLGFAGTRDNCLDRSLVMYRYLSTGGFAPELVVGARKHEEGVLGHAWVLVDGRPMAESHRSLDEFTPLLVFGPEGSLRSQKAVRPDLDSPP